MLLNLFLLTLMSAMLTGLVLFMCRMADAHWVEDKRVEFARWLEPDGQVQMSTSTLDGKSCLESKVAFRLGWVGDTAPTPETGCRTCANMRCLGRWRCHSDPALRKHGPWAIPFQTDCRWWEPCPHAQELEDTSRVVPVDPSKLV
jgi:hypothetical protein